MSRQQNPSSLVQMTLNAVSKTLQKSVQKLDAEFDEACSSQGESLTTRNRGDKNNKSSASSNSSSQCSSSLSLSTNNSTSQGASMDLAVSIMKIKRHIRQHVPSDLMQLLLDHAITYAVVSKTVAITRFVMTNELQHLNLLGTDIWRTKNMVPDWQPLEMKDSGPSKSKKSERLSQYLDKINPPNEFDWYSPTRMGRVLTVSDVIEIFSILKSIKFVGSNLKSLQLNAKHGRKLIPKDPFILDSFTNMRNLTTLVLRGVCTDEVMKVIGRTMSSLKVLDVSYSKLVTDVGVRHLFYEEVVAPDVLYTLPTWVSHSTPSMTSVVRSLDLLDFSYAGVTNDSFALVSCTPGAYVFKRAFALSRDSAFAHAIFLRQKAIASELIHSKSPSFQTKLGKLLGRQGREQFLALCNSVEDKWEESNLSLYLFKPQGAAGGNSQDRVLIGLVTSSPNEKLVNGMVKFKNGKMTLAYSIFPMNTRSCKQGWQALDSLQGILNEGVNFIPSNLKNIEVFAMPSAICLILRTCPNLCQIKFRVINGVLHDDDILSNISNCKDTVEEFWAAPGSYKQPLPPNEEASSGEQQMIPEVNNNQSVIIASTLIGHGEKSKLEPNCQLSTVVARTLLRLCPNLKSLGDLAWWSGVDAKDLSSFCDELKSSNSSLAMHFDDILLPDFELTRDI